MSDGVKKGILTLVAANLADEEDRVEDDAGDECGEEDDAQDREGEGALVKNDPADVEGYGETDGKDAECDESGDGSAASGDVHAT